MHVYKVQILFCASSSEPCQGPTFHSVCRLQSRRHVLACTGLQVVVKPGVNRHFIRRSRAPSVFPACTVFRPDSQFDPFVTSQISFKCLHSTSLKLLASTSHLVEEIKCFPRDMSGSRSRSRPIWGQRSNKQDKLLHHSPICDPADIWIYRPICLWITSHQVMHHVLLDIRKEINWGWTVLLDFMWNWWLILEILVKFVFHLTFFSTLWIGCSWPKFL